MGIEDEFTHRIGHEEAGIAPHRDQLPDFRRGYLQLGYGVDENAARARFVQIVDAPSATVY